MHNLKPIDMIIIILIVSIFFIIFKNNSEHLTPQSNEAIQNLGSIYNSSSMTTTNLNVTGTFNLLPTGTIVMWNGSTIPTGWLLCDGTNGTPDLRGRFVLGSGNGAGLTARKLADQGGEENHTLTVPEIPAHYHQYYDVWYTESSSGSTIFDKQGRSVSTRDPMFGTPGRRRGSGDSDSDNTMMTELVGTSSNIGVAGSDPVTVGNSHNNMPPYYVLTYIMKS